MPAPSQQALKNEFLAALDPLFFDGGGSVTAEQDEWLTALTQAIHDAWSDWEAGIGGGGLTVSGSGIGTWTGTGDGGSLMEGSTLDWTAQPSFGRTSRLAELDDALASAAADRFTTWVGDYSFAGATYTGSSTATSTSAGTFTATAVGSEVLANIGSGTTPDAVKADVITELEGQGWQPDKTDGHGNRIPKIREWLDAFDAMLQTQFDEWLAATVWVDNSVTGEAASGTGSGASTSFMDGAVQ